MPRHGDQHHRAVLINVQTFRVALVWRLLKHQGLPLDGGRSNLRRPGAPRPRAGLAYQFQFSGSNPHPRLREVQHPAGMVPVAVAQNHALRKRHARLVQLRTRTDHRLVVLEEQAPPHRHTLLVLIVDLVAHAGVEQQVVIMVLDQEGREIRVHLLGDAAARHQQCLGHGHLGCFDDRKAHLWKTVGLRRRRLGVQQSHRKGR